MRVHDVPINWRMAHHALAHPVVHFDFDISHYSEHKAPWGVFVPLHRDVAILPMRDWLHDDAVEAGFALFGRYSVKASNVTCTGFLIELFNEADACLFHLTWR